MPPYTYLTLLILTDGSIHDFEETKDLIVKLSKYPVSIIIIGVGDDDMSEMEALDSDKGRLSGKGAKASRDIV